jgi:hypothetical protein
MFNKIGKLRFYEEITQPHLSYTRVGEIYFVSLDFCVLFDQAKRTTQMFLIQLTQIN